MEDITAILAFEVKKEMADRYFGFRKRIEDDTAAYVEHLEQSALELENDIGFALLRLYTLLHKEVLIEAFLNLTKLPKDLFYDQYTLESPTIHKRIFANQQYHGLTRKRGFRNMFFDTYLQLSEHIDNYRNTINQLTEEQETIREEINLFYRNNDIDSIMQFIRKFDSPDTSVLNTLQPNGNGGPGQSLSSKMRLHPPRPATEVLPSIPALPPFKTIRQKLKQLVNSAYEGNPDLDLKELTRKQL